jgi:hypothetical protein
MVQDYRKRFRHSDGKPIIPEREFRQILMEEAKFKGAECAIGLQMLFDKWDRLMKSCTNPDERLAMSKLGIKEISDYMDGKYLGYGGNLTVNGEVIKISQDDIDNGRR